MMQIGNPQAPPAVYREGQPAPLDRMMGWTRRDGANPADGVPAGDADEGNLFVSPPPLPWPRVFPGL